MISWLLETLFWTAVLIAGVLLVRRPVARWFGPQVAYALWALPVLRLMLPPIELPAWMGSSPIPAPTTTTHQNVILDPATPVATTNGPAGLEAAVSDAPTPITPVPSFDLGPFFEIGIAVWLIGAAIFLYLRFSAYFILRAELLENASEVGRNGNVRLVETQGTDAPLAFGVIDKVIALPRGFLAQPDRTARDLALAHEMAHHEGHDLLINVLVQPLFALHWFNPLGRYGWLALRRDQEAACDARVVAAKPAKDREAYANLIVSFAAGPNVAPNHALTAPMACPVLGEKSIIHRLRSLKMNDTSKSRRLAGRLMLGACVVALPLTASISYAASEAPLPPEPPQAPSLNATPPAPPSPPAPPALQADETAIIEIDPDIESSGDDTREEHVFVIETDDENGERTVSTYRTVDRVVVRDGQGMSEEEIEKVIAEMRQGFSEADKTLEELPVIIEEALADADAMGRGQGRTVVKLECDTKSEDVATTVEGTDGTRVVMLCQSRVMAHALSGLKEARQQIAQNREMSKRMRERILEELDQQIESWEDAAS